MNPILNKERYAKLEELLALRNAGPNSAKLLTSIDKQVAFIHAMHKSVSPCPNPSCAKHVSPYDAALNDITDSKRSISDDAYRCPHCRACLRWALPFVGGWYWILRLPKPHEAEDQIMQDIANAVGATPAEVKSAIEDERRR